MAAEGYRGVGGQAPEEIAGRPAHHAQAGGAPGGDDVVAGGGDHDLAVGLAAGNHEALAELYDRYAGLAYGVAIRVLGDPGRAEDAVQEAFVNIWKRAASFDADRGSLRAWLLTTVRNRCIDYVRGRSAHERLEQELQPDSVRAIASSDPWREVALSLERSAVRDAMATLPIEQRQ